MRNTFLNGLGAIALAAVASVATAQVPAHQTTQADPAASTPAPHRRGAANLDLTQTRAEFVDARVARLTALDLDRDGAVSAQERETAMQARHAERADKMFAKLDADSDGAITRAEFDAGRQARGERGPRAERAAHRGGPRHAMRGRGAEARGPVVISQVAAKLGEQFDKMDADRDGVVSAEERRTAMTAHRAERQAERQRRRATRSSQQPASPAPASE